MQPLEVGHVGDDEAQQVIEFAGHEIALHDLGDVPDRILECCELTLLLAMQADVHEYVPAKPRHRLVHERHVAIDHAFIFEGADTTQAGGLGQVDGRRELHVAGTAVLLQGPEDRSVVFVQMHSRKLLKNGNGTQKMP